MEQCVRVRLGDSEGIWRWTEDEESIELGGAIAVRMNRGGRESSRLGEDGLMTWRLSSEPGAGDWG